MFDSTAQFELKVRAPEGMKSVVLRFPSDHEQAERLRKQKMVTTDMGRGIESTTTEVNYQHDLDLVKSLMVEDVDLDEYEASYLLSKLCYAESRPAERIDNTYRIAVKTVAGVTYHTLAVPSRKEMTEYGRSSFRTVNRTRHGVSESTVNLEASGALYDKLVRGTEGIQGSVPLLFKSAAVQELLATLREEEEADRDTDFR